eukprot:1195132-Prorocentrum_minimum.AAC.5
MDGYYRSQQRAGRRTVDGYLIQPACFGRLLGVFYIRIVVPSIQNLTHRSGMAQKLPGPCLRMHSACVAHSGEVIGVHGPHRCTVPSLASSSR